jgi:hypothetical protein
MQMRAKFHSCESRLAARSDAPIPVHNPGHEPSVAACLALRGYFTARYWVLMTVTFLAACA